MKQEFIITSEKHYHETMVTIYEMMNRGEEKLTEAELEKLGLMTRAAEKFEDETLEQRPDSK